MPLTHTLFLEMGRTAVIRQASVLAAAALISAATAALAAAPAAQATTISAAGIDATGTQDDTAALQAMIDSVPDGSTVSFTAGGKYRIEGTLHVKNKHDLVIQGNGALFFATTTGDRTRSQWSFEGGSNIVVKNVVVKGANPDAGTGSAAYVESLEAQHAFNIWSTNGIELDHVTATDVYGDFVYVGLQAGGFAKNVYIHNSSFARNGRQGISVTGADGVRIVSNTITDTRRATFDLEPNGPSWGVFNIDIEYNTIGPGRLNVLSAAGIGPEANITFSNNQINRPFNMQVGDTKDGRRGPFIITGNIATQTWGSAAGSGALNFWNIDGLTVEGNTLPLQAGRGDYGVKATNSCDVIVSGNNFSNAVADSYVTPGPSCATPTATPVSTPAPTTSSAPLPPPPPVATTTPTSPSAPTTTSATPSEPTTTTSISPSASASASGKPTPASTHAAAGNVKKSAHPSPQNKHDATVTSAHQQVPPGSDGGSATIDLAAATTSTSSLFSARNAATGGAALLLLGFIAFRLFRRRPRLARTARRHPTRVPTGPFATEVLPQRFAR